MPKTDSQQSTVGWSGINWRKVSQTVWKLQKRIYRASQCGNTRKVRSLEKTLLPNGKTPRTPQKNSPVAEATEWQMQTLRTQLR